MQLRRFDTTDSLWDDFGAIIYLAAAIGVSRYIGATLWALSREALLLVQSL